MLKLGKYPKRGDYMRIGNARCEYIIGLQSLQRSYCKEEFEEWLN
ncbi:MAG: hypothetical protein QXN96_00195 [Candidatus Bathyarchaeia archaeon]